MFGWQCSCSGNPVINLSLIKIMTNLTKFKDTGYSSSFWGPPSHCSMDTSAFFPRCTSHEYRIHEICWSCVVKNKQNNWTNFVKLTIANINFYLLPHTINKVIKKNQIETSIKLAKHSNIHFSLYNNKTLFPVKKNITDEVQGKLRIHVVTGELVGVLNDAFLIYIHKNLLTTHGTHIITEVSGRHTTHVIILKKADRKDQRMTETFTRTYIYLSLYIYIYIGNWNILKGVVHQQKLCRMFLFIRTDLVKFSITSLAVNGCHQNENLKDTKFLQVCSYEQTNSSTSWMV